MSAYRMHGEKVRTGEQREYLAPGGTAEYIG